MRLIYVLPVWLLLSGCSFTNSAQTSISAVMAGIQEDLTKAGVVSASDVQGWSEEQAARFDANVRALQCAQRNVDPVVALVSGPVAMQLNGSLTQSGSFSVSALTSVPVLGITAEASRSKTQQLSLPVQFVPLSALPDAEMQREVEYAGALMSQSDAIRQREGEKILLSRQTLAAHILELQKLDVLKLCKADQPVRPFVGLHEH
ncbi:hypothetical protein [Gluconobacter japonicus]|uniref:hypothetical protein n=1 Tax=Gluconobacter japonicus TaxID=376620 RepID=UPI0003D2F65A|nr:hypothetical protein [Gluconobacter japonicus]MBS1049948.1 hypothetical protein [Gluconobacter japonicus]GAD10374.1 hypothetical protein GFGA_1d0549 [Gluconobacter frateurii NBRC 103465]